MMKLQDYIHYYIGCKINKDIDALEYPTIKGIHGDRVIVSEYKYRTPDCKDCFTRPQMYQCIGFIKPILRRLEDMTEEENVEIFGSDVHWYKPFDSTDACDVQQWQKLLQKSFDLFGLIDAGLAIDAKTIPNECLKKCDNSY